MAEGPKAGTRNVGRWRYYAEDGTLSSEGDFVNGKKNGTWNYYYPSGEISSAGNYELDLPTGEWKYYFEDGKLSASGEFVGGKKNGYWSAFNQNGSLKSEVDFIDGTGEYREYYAGGNLKVKGGMVDGKNEGHWSYYFENGKLEGECQFEKGKGVYSGYYQSGTLQTKGVIEDDLRVGTWELYAEDGSLTGYYKPFYEDNHLAVEINSLLNKPVTPVVTVSKSGKRGFYYFTERFPEYRGVIIQGNPFSAFIGTFPVAIEFYNQERLGHEFEFEGIRDPFFVSDGEVPNNIIFHRGYSIAAKQKFYNPMKTGMWYFAHEVRFSNVGHFTNMTFSQQQLTQITASASEQRAEYGVLLGTRLMQKNDGDGFTIDAYVGYGIGYRSYDVEPIFENVFSALNSNKFSHSFRFGFNFGYSFSFDGRR
ncbi:MAG: toxin-antitoxin system YwqK family antitoxin [Cyclobacteriaceae bacterium]|nr:toxin-antitoxin system YwqK family antitoxin [Cyclobacteriaceae bacterium]